jgi:hypothetical protein
LFTRGEAAPGVMSIRFTTLDNPSKFQPMLDIWTSSAQPWTCLSQFLTIPKCPSWATCSCLARADAASLAESLRLAGLPD